MALNWSGLTQGALSGAATGTAAAPGLGTAAGALVGGIAGLFGKKKKKKISTLDKDQQKLNKYQSQSILGKGPLADLYNYDPQAANAVFDQNQARVAYRDLNEKAIPSLTGQFRNQGLMNSSYAGDAVGRLIRDVQEKLMGERSKYLYDEQKESRGAKRNALENTLNRQTFARDEGQKPFDINSIITSITPDTIGKFKDYFKKPDAGSTTPSTSATN